MSLEEVRDLIKHHVLPRLDKLEAEIFMLRTHVWPHVQAMKEKSQLSNLPEKREFFSVLNEYDLLELLKLKNEFSKGNDWLLEYDQLKKMLGAI